MVRRKKSSVNPQIKKEGHQKIGWKKKLKGFKW
jgi:hypothetical protein